MQSAQFLEKIRTKEMRDLAIAIAALSFGFAMIAYDTFNFTSFGTALLLVMVTFLPHELAHRGAARSMQVDATFTLWPVGALLAVLTPFLGVLFAAPGAVQFQFNHYRRFGKEQTELTTKHIGTIALAGPLANIILGGILWFFSQWISIAMSAAYLSFLLAFFNLLPLPPLDGEKVMRWKPSYWFTLQAVSLILLLI